VPDNLDGFVGFASIEPVNTINTINGHRSIRRYKPDPVPEELLTELLEAGIRASSSGNMQTYSIVVTRDRELRERLYEPHMEQNMVLDAPVLMTFCADFNRMRKWLAISDAPDNFDDFFAFLVAAVDAILVSQNVALAAEAKGLGICYMGSTLANCDQIGEILELPKGVFPVVGFSLGYPAEDPPKRDRLPLDGLVHYETYQDYTEDRIAEIYRDRNQAGWDRYMRIPELRQMVEEHGVENLAQIYTVVKYTKEGHDRYTRNVLDYLRNQDFFRS
jgi:nitroreductase